jgi:hypothetical protein
MQAVTLEVILRLVLGVRDPFAPRRLREALPDVLGAACSPCVV